MINYQSRIYQLPIILSPFNILPKSIFEEILYITPIYSIIPNKKICVIINGIVLYKSCILGYHLIKTIINFGSKIISTSYKFGYCFYKGFYRAYQETFYNETFYNEQTLQIDIKEVFKQENEQNIVFNCDKGENENKVFNCIPMYDKWENESNEWASNDVY